MTALIACLGSGKGTWTEVRNLINAETWDKVFLVTNTFGKQNFQADAEFILLDDFQPAEVLTPLLISQLRGKIPGAEIAFNLSSGSGNVHMALVAALLKLGLGIRLVIYSNSKVEEL